MYVLFFLLNIIIFYLMKTFYLIKEFIYIYIYKLLKSLIIFYEKKVITHYKNY